MSNYKSEEWFDIWDSLFWRFVDEYKNIFKSQHRLSIILRNLGRMAHKKRSA